MPVDEKITTTLRAVPVPTGTESSLDQVLNGIVRAYDRHRDADRVAWIAEAAALHVEHCPVYARLATAAGFDPADLSEPKDLERVPLVPSSLFKKRLLRSRSEGAVRECLSSGTQGTRSVVLRDGPTMERFIAGLVHGSREFYEQHDVREGFVLGPSGDEAGSLWFSYVVGLVDLEIDTGFFVRDDLLQPVELARALQDLTPGTQPVIVGPPPLLWDFCRWAMDEKVDIDLRGTGALVVTAGGWKARAGEQIDRSRLTTMLSDTLGVEGRLVRDLFNMVELNSVVFECEHHRKHIPPWLEVIPRRAADMGRVDPGEDGVLTYLDPTATSYPCFVFSDDVGTVSDGPCPCGRAGRTLSLTRRLARIDERGCALKMDRYSSGRRR